MQGTVCRCRTPEDEKRRKEMVAGMASSSSQGLSYAGRDYSIELREGRWLCLQVGGRRFADLRVASAVNGPGEAEDVSRELRGPVLSECAGGLRAVWSAASSLWDEKRFILECRPDGLAYRVEVKGRGSIGAVEFLAGEGAGAPSSLYRFDRIFTPEVSLLDRRYLCPQEYACVDATSGETAPFPVPSGETAHWIFSPPPFAFAWSRGGSGPWLGVGIAPQPGEYRFNLFQHWPVANCFKLRLTYDGMTRVEGEWRSPDLLLLPASGEYDAIHRCVSYLYENNLAVRPDRSGRPGWWSRPIFCGWGQQNMTAVARGGNAPQWARQDVYDEFLQMLDERGIDPGTLIIDDKWQKCYGTLEVDTEKWPDLRGWIGRQHARGRRVLLWFGAWSPEGLPPEECILRDGNPVVADPSNPAYEERLRRAIRVLLSDAPGCFDADGFKVDWTNGLPFGEGFRVAGDLWGIELLKRLAWIIYDEAKRVKPDALIITHMANPYFAEVTDMLRLNDISYLQRGVCDIMRHRQRLALIACPDWLIDCDNSSAPTQEEWLEYMMIQPELGVPSLYFLTGVDGTGEPIPLEDWKRIPAVWRGPR
jgi:hypothetical protein